MTKRIALVCLLMASALTACGKSDTKPASSGNPTTTTEATTATAAAPATTVSLEAKEYSYSFTSGTPTIPAGSVTITLANKGTVEHQLSIIKLKGGKTPADLATLAKDPSKLGEVVDTFGGPNAVAPGGSNTTTQVLGAGDYFFVCFIPAADGQPHVSKGMIAPVTVTGDAAPAAAAAADNQIELKDYAFGVGASGAVKAGTYQFTNSGPQAHEAAIYKPAAGKTVQDVIDYFKNPSPTAGAPPFSSAGGIGPITKGNTAETDLSAGEYVFVCFIPDAKDGAPHFVHGMLQAVTVS